MVSVFALCLLIAAPPEPTLGPRRLVRAEPGATLEVVPCAPLARCSGTTLELLPGPQTLLVRRAGSRTARSELTIPEFGSFTVRAPDTTIPSRFAEDAWSSMAVAIGVALVGTALVVVGMDGAHGRDLRTGMPVVAGIGGVLLVGGGVGLKWLDSERTTPIDVPLDLIADVDAPATAPLPK